MAKGPNLNRLVQLVEQWSVGARSYQETVDELARVMAPENHVPESELAPLQMPDPGVEQLQRVLDRVESRLVSLTRHLAVPLPDDLSPGVLAEDLRTLVDQGRVLEAIAIHRCRTGAALVEAKRAVDEYRGHRSS